jgi:hypothetical protein
MPVRVGDLTGIPGVLYGRMIIVRAQGPENDPLLRAMIAVRRLARLAAARVPEMGDMSPPSRLPGRWLTTRLIGDPEH